jgi:hypothetical protein
MCCGPQGTPLRANEEEVNMATESSQTTFQWHGDLQAILDDLAKRPVPLEGEVRRRPHVLAVRSRAFRW